MQDINGLIKECDNDNLLLDTLKHFINDLTKIMGNEIPENVLDEYISNNTEGFGMAFNFLNNALRYIAQGGGSGGSSGATYLSINAELNDETTDSFEVINLDSLYYIRDSYFNITYTNKTESDFGGFSVGRYDSSEHSFGGVIPCTYKDTSGYHTGVLKFNEYGVIALYPSNEVTQLNGDIKISFSGTLSVVMS